ncbi:MAG: hypothetical protein ABL878_08965 [Burkholderiales bacterium]
MAYNPPKQAGIGQIIDSVIILVLLFICLLVPFLWKKHMAAVAAEAPAAEAAVAAAEPTWDELKQTPVQAQQWEKLGKKPADAKGLIETQFDFDADLRSWKLPVTVVVIVAYFFFLLRISDREYREVIDEKFGKSR